MPTSNILNKITHEFIEECKKCDLQVNTNFANHIIHLLVRDARVGLDMQKLSECKVRSFLEIALKKLANPLDATICSLKLTHYFRSKSGQNMNLDYVKEQSEEKFKNKLKLLIDDILQFPETSNKEQIDQMFNKMQVFIIACYSIGNPKNHVLLKQIRQSLNSVIGRGDLQNYVLKKKYHRLEYLQRLSATVCGILIYNNHGPTGEKENMRDIFADLAMAQINTKESLQSAIERASKCKSYGLSSMENAIEINVLEKKAYCSWPMEKARAINSFIVLFSLYQNYLEELLAAYEKSKYLISVSVDKFKCVVSKINDVLKYRTAIESEAIFPHFVYLSEVWSSLVLYLHHLTELNVVKDQLDLYVTDDLEAKFIDTVEEVRSKSEATKHYIETAFVEFVERTSKRNEKCNLLKIKNNSKDYCSLTLALTNGLIVPAHVQKKLCENLEMRFGFGNIQLAKYAESHFEEYLQTYTNTIYTNVDLILLFGLDQYILRDDLRGGQMDRPKRRDFETQTEMVVENDLSVANRINVTWNAWDFHRETIRLANMRKKQTRSTQSVLTYSQRNAQNQTYHTRRHM